MPDRLPLVFFLLVVVGGGLAIGVVTAPGDWYRQLAKPAFNPPGWCWRQDRVAAWLFAPYPAWVAFATLLNASILVLNGSPPGLRCIVSNLECVSQACARSRGTPRPRHSCRRGSPSSRPLPDF